MCVGDPGIEFVARQSAGQALDLGVARSLQHLDGRRMNALQQEKLNPGLVDRRFDHALPTELISPNVGGAY